MRLTIDTASKTLAVDDAEGSSRVLPLFGGEAFELLSGQWLKIGWTLGHWRGFSWLGRQILQLPQDVLRLQEVLCFVRPDVIIETGICEGGGSVFFASICELLRNGRVFGVERNLRPEVRVALERHTLAARIRLFEGDSVAPEVLSRVKASIRPGESVFVFLDSDHSKAHVARELAAYAPLVTPGSYIVVADGVMALLADAPTADPRWRYDNPTCAAQEFVAANSNFEVAMPRPLFPSKGQPGVLTYFPDGWLKRMR